jgi:hypothetical protein
MRFFQLAPEPRLAGVDHCACKEAVLELVRQKRNALGGLSLGTEQCLYPLDDVFAMRQEKSQQLNMCLKRHDAPR